MGINRNENIHQNIHDQKSIFLPMFCRLSIKDVKVNTIPISAAEPSSPKVSCIGQVKRSNRITAATTTTITTAANHHKYTKSKSMHLFAKTLLPNPTTMNSASAKAAGAAVGGGRSGSRSCRTIREVGLNDLRRPRVVKKNCDDQEVDISEMDPPLPVVKRAAPPCEVNIWKRRSNGVKALKIEPIDLPNHNKIRTTLSILS